MALVSLEAISVPEFMFIGYDQPTFKVATEDGGVLSWVTPEIDKVEMVNKILDDDARQTYVSSNSEVLKDQTKAFYNTLIASIDPAIVTSSSSVHRRRRPPRTGAVPRPPHHRPVRTRAPLTLERRVAGLLLQSLRRPRRMRPA